MPLASHQIIQRGINQHQPARVLLIALALAAWLIPSHRASALIGVGAIDTPGDAFDVEVVGGLAYVAIGVSGLQIIDFGPEYFLGWVLYDRDAEEISRFATITDLIADQSFAGAEPIAPTGFEAIASERATWVL